MAIETEVFEKEGQDGQNEAQNEASHLVEVSAGTTIGEGEEATKVTASVTFDPKPTLAEAVDEYGEDTVYDLYSRMAQRDLSNAIRSRLNSGYDVETVEVELSDWRPDVTPSRRSKDPRVEAKKLLAKLGGDEIESLLAEMGL